MNYRYIKYQPMKQSYDKIICFQYFSISWSRVMTDIQVLNWGRRIFSAGCESLVREEFLKQPVGNSNTYDLKLENAMFGEFNVMTVQTLETWTKWAPQRSFTQLILEDKNPQHSLKQLRNIIIHTKLMTTITFQLNRPKDIIKDFSHETFVVITTNIKIQ